MAQSIHSPWEIIANNVIKPSGAQSLSHFDQAPWSLRRIGGTPLHSIQTQWSSRGLGENVLHYTNVGKITKLQNWYLHNSFVSVYWSNSVVFFGCLDICGPDTTILAHRKLQCVISLEGPHQQLKFLPKPDTKQSFGQILSFWHGRASMITGCNTKWSSIYFLVQKRIMQTNIFQTLRWIHTHKKGCSGPNCVSWSSFPTSWYASQTIFTVTFPISWVKMMFF